MHLSSWHSLDRLNLIGDSDVINLQVLQYTYSSCDTIYTKG